MRIRIILASSILALSALGQACSSDDSGSSRKGFNPAPGGHNPATGGGDGGGTQTGVGADDAGTTNVDPDAEAPPTGVCNFQDNVGTAVTVTNTSGTMPLGAGGAQPLDGSYLATAVTHYGGSRGRLLTKRRCISPRGRTQYMISKNGGADERSTVSVEYQPDGSLLWTGKCGSTMVATLHYAAPTETSLIVYDSTTNTAFTYTRPDPPDPTP